MGFQPQKNEWTDSQTQALMTYRQAGLPIKAIAAEMGMTKGQVLGRIWRVEHPAQSKFRDSLWTDRQKEIARLGAFHSADIDETCELLAKAGRSMSPDRVRDSQHYRLGLTQAKAVEERLARETAVAVAKKPRPGVYVCRNYPSHNINLPVVKGYTPEAAHG